MNRKIAFRRIWIIVLVVAFVLFGIIYVCTTPYRWSGKLCNAIRLGKTDKALILISKGAEKGYSMDTLSAYPSPLWTLLESTPITPMQAACKYGNYLVAKQLFEAGATGCPSEDGSPWVPLLYILNRPYSPDDFALVELLIENGAIPEKEMSGVISTAAAFRAPLNFNAEKDSITEKYPYDIAVAEGITEVFLLLSEYFDCYATNDANRNALHCAAAIGNWNLVEVLSQQFDFPLEATDANGKTAYDYAMEQGFEEFAELLEP